MRKTTINPVRRLVAELEKAHDELDDISSKLSRSNDSGIAHAELDLWEDRTCQSLVDSGASEAATRLRKAKGTIVAGEFDENLERKIDAKESVLVALLNDFADHPEFWTKKLIAGLPTGPVDNAVSRMVFLGHGRSPLWSRVHFHLHDELSLQVEVWESTSRVGQHSIEVLKELLGKCGFAVLIATGDDSTVAGEIRARQNVIHEIGLFQGRVGFEKVALIEQEGVAGFSNIDGLQRIRFPSNKIEHAFYELDRTLRREGFIK